MATRIPALLKDGSFWTAVGSLAAVVAVALALWQTMLTNHEAAEQRDEASERREYDRKVLAAMSQPHLGFEKMTHVVNAFIKEEPFAIQMDTKSNQLPKIRNLGTGAALNCQLEYCITKINDEELKAPQRSVSPLPVRNLAPGGESPLFNVPFCIFQDGDRTIKDVEGKVVLRCEQVDGQEREVTTDFVLAMNYNHEPPRIEFVLAGVDSLADEVVQNIVGENEQLD